MLSLIVFSDLESDKFLQCHQLIISKGWEISEGIFIFAPQIFNLMGKVEGH